MKLSALEIAKEKLERPDRLLGDVDERILAEAVVKLTEAADARDIRYLEKVVGIQPRVKNHYIDKSVFEIIELQAEALKEAARLINIYMEMDASDGRAMECGDWLAKYGEKK